MRDVFPPDISKGRVDPARGQVCAQGSVLAPKSTTGYPGKHMLSLAEHWCQQGRLTRKLQQDQQQCSLPGCKPPPVVAPGLWLKKWECCSKQNGQGLGCQMFLPFPVFSLRMGEKLSHSSAATAPASAHRVRRAGNRESLGQGEPGPVPTWPERQTRGPGGSGYMALGLCCRRRRGQDSFCCMESARLAGEPDTVGKWVSLGV